MWSLTTASVSDCQGATVMRIKVVSRGEYKNSQRCALCRALEMVNAKRPLALEARTTGHVLVKTTQRQVL